MEPQCAAGDELISLLGHSIESRPLVAVMEALRVERNPQVQRDNAGNAYDTESANKARTIILTFTGCRRFLREYGTPLFVVDEHGDELILVEVEVAAALGIAEGDGAATIVTRLGRKPYEKSTDVSYGQAWWFRFDDYRLLTALDPRLRLLWLRAFRLTSKEREAAELKKHLARQRANIKPESAPAILAKKTRLPTVEWHRRKAAGDTNMTDEGIVAVSDLLTAYLDTLAEHAQKKKAANIYNSVKSLVRALNKVNARHAHGLIETLEREELAAFINEAVRATGLAVQEGVDLTEEWRAW